MVLQLSLFEEGHRGSYKKVYTDDTEHASGVQFEQMASLTWIEALRFVELHCCGKHAWKTQPTDPGKEPKTYEENIQQPNKLLENSVQRVDLVAGCLQLWDWKCQTWVLKQLIIFDKMQHGMNPRK